MEQIELFACDAGHPEAPGGLGRKKRGRARAWANGWALEDHVCRECFGRLLSTVLGSGRTLYRCSNCGAEAEGHAPDVLCSCGLKVRSLAPGQPLVDAGLRCQVNPSPTAAFPSQIVAAEARS